MANNSKNSNFVKNIIPTPRVQQLMDEKYKKSGVWKCEASPTGAHHWIIDKNGHTQYCIYCNETKDVPKIEGRLAKCFGNEKYNNKQDHVKYVTE